MWLNKRPLEAPAVFLRTGPSQNTDRLTTAFAEKERAIFVKHFLNQTNPIIMKSVYVSLLTGMVIVSSPLLAQKKGEMTFTSSADLAKAKSKYLAPSYKDKQEIKNIISASSAAY